MLNDMDEIRDNIEDQSTIEDTISTGNEITLSYINTSILSKLEIEDTDDTIDVPEYNVCYDYLKELIAIADKKISIRHIIRSNGSIKIKTLSTPDMPY